MQPFEKQTFLKMVKYMLKFDWAMTRTNYGGSVSRPVGYNILEIDLAFICGLRVDDLGQAGRIFLNSPMCRVCGLSTVFSIYYIAGSPRINGLRIN